MSKKVLVISSSLRPDSNSDALAVEFVRGAADAGHAVEHISLKEKTIAFCRGCLACAKLGHCVIDDDAVEIEQKVLNADVVVFSTPIYYYTVSGQLKTLLDRLNPLYPKDCRFSSVYLLCTGDEDGGYVYEKAAADIRGWVSCFKQAEFSGALFCGGLYDPGAISGHETLKDAYQLGLNC